MPARFILRVVKEPKRRGWATKRWTTKKGSARGGQPFTKNRLYQLLTNVAQIGKVRYKSEIHQREAGPPPPAGRVPRVSRLMALAIRFEQLIRDGTVAADQAELARLGHVTRARITQIMNLLNLAPDIQETILFPRPVESGKDPITDQDLRSIAALVDWQKQWMMWKDLAGRP